VHWPEDAGVSLEERRWARPEAVLFDWDNTLVDSWKTLHQALNIALAAMGKPQWSLVETRQRVRLSLRDHFPRLFGERCEEARRLYLDAFRAIHLKGLRALPGRQALLQALFEEGVYLAVVSNKTGAILRIEVEALGWAKFFGSLVGAGDAPFDKPDPAPVRLALEPAGMAACEKVWLVGDTGIDMECAHRSGCLPVLLGGIFSRAEFARASPALVFSHAEALFRFFEDL
jgi:phosphoglycolate phosphatase